MRKQKNALTEEVEAIKSELSKELPLWERVNLDLRLLSRYRKLVDLLLDDSVGQEDPQSPGPVNGGV